MAGGVPASTSSTTTINQSPWQNPTYRALALGTTDKPGPVTSLIRNAAAETAAYNSVMASPNFDFSSTKHTAPPGAAQGGLMSLRGYAAGGGVKDLTPTQRQAVAAFNATITGGGTPTAAQIAQINNIEQATGRNVSPYTNTGTAAVGNAALQESINTAAGSKNYPTSVGTSPNDSITKANPDSTAGIAAAAATQKNLEGLVAGAGQHIYGVTTDAAGNITSSNPYLNQVADKISNLGMPGQIGQATDAYNNAISGLSGMTNYSPQQVAAQQAAASQASAQQGSAQQGSAQQAAASLADRGSIRDVNAQQAQVDKYNASLMNAPTAAEAKGYDAALAQAAQMTGPKNVSAERMQAAQMAGPQNVSAQDLQQYQMQGPQSVSANALQNFQMQGPGSWTDPGVSQKYMNPYQQGVIDIAKRQKDVDYQKQMAGINAQAASAGAFGGAGQAMERSQASKDYQQQLQDLETQGMSQAYQSGMSQYGQESGLSQQSNIQNLQAMLGVQQTGSAQDLQAALANQGMDYNTAVQNLQSKLATQQLGSGQNLQAALANQQAGLTTGQANLSAEQQARANNQQVGMQSQVANQGAALTTGQANLGAQQQTALSNQAALNTQQQQYVQNALQADMQAYGGQLTAAQQIAVAQNATSQFNSQAQNTAYNQYATQQLAAQQMNQGVDAQTALQNAQLATQTANQNASLGTQASLQNAQLGTQASLTNAQLGTQAAMQNASLGTQASLANAQNALQAGMANQAAGLSANQQNLGAYGMMGNMATGLGNLGATQSQIGLNNIGAQGNLASSWQALGQSTTDATTNNARYFLGMPTTINAGALNAINSQPSTAGNTGTTTSAKPGTFKRGGRVNGPFIKRGAR